MPIYHARLALHISPDEEETIRREEGLPPGASVLEAVHQTAWEGLVATGAESGRWHHVEIT